MKTSIKTVLATILAMLLFLLGAACPAFAAPKQATIDVLVVFDKTAIKNIKKPYTCADGKKLPPLGIDQTAELAVEEINTIFANSGINSVSLNCCGIFHLDYSSQAGNKGKKLDYDLYSLIIGNQVNEITKEGTIIYNKQPLRGKLGNQTGLTIQQAMEKSKADICVLFTYYPLEEDKYGVLGMARSSNMNELTRHDSSGALGQYAVFNVLTIRKSDPTFSHEFCHLIGAGHSDFQLDQSGPQAEYDSAGYLTEDHAFCTLLTYSINLNTLAKVSPSDSFETRARKVLYSSEKDQLFPGQVVTTPLKVLSGPKPFQFTGTDASGKKVSMKVKVGDEDTHNNTAVILRHASAASVYHLSGNEQIINDDFDQATPVPALIPFAQKKARILRSTALWQIANSGTSARDLLSVWHELDEVCAQVIKKTEAEDRFIGPAFQTNDPQNTYMSSLLGTCASAGSEAGEPKMEGGCGSTVWYKVTTPVAGDLEIGIIKGRTINLKPVLGVFRGSSVTNLKHLPHTVVQGDGRDEHFVHRIKVNVPENDTLYIAVDNQQNEINIFHLLVKLTKGSYNGPPVDNPPPAPEPTPEPAPAPAPTPEPTPAPAPAPEPTPAPAPTPEPTPAPAPGGASQISEWRTADYALLATSLLALLVSMGTIIALVSKQEKEQPDIGGLPPIAPPQGIAVPPGSNEQMEVHAETPRHASPSIPDMKICLRGVLSNGSPAEYTISLREVAQHHNFYIGRDPSCHLCIPDETISHSHAVLKLRPDGKALALLLGDNGSSNGTRIGDVRLNKKGECVKVHNRTRVSFGKSEFVITLSK